MVSPRSVLCVLSVVFSVRAICAIPATAQEPCSANTHWELTGAVRNGATHISGARDEWRASRQEIASLTSLANNLLKFVLALDYVGQPKGLQVEYYRALGAETPGVRTLTSQPIPLKVEAMVFGFVCAGGKVTRRWTDADSGIEIIANSLSDILNNTGTMVGGQQAYRLDLGIGAYRGYPLFAPETTQPGSDSHYRRSLLITRPGRLPFRYVTRAEFFQSLREDLDKNEEPEVRRIEASIRVRPSEEQEAEKARRVAEIRSYNLNEHSKQARIKRYLADFKTDEQRRDEAVATLRGLYAARRKRLDALTARYRAELEQPATVLAGASTNYGLLDSGDWDFISSQVDLSRGCTPRCRYGQSLVVLDERYFDKRLPRTAPQVFLVNVTSLFPRSDLSSSQLKIREQALAEIELSALAALLPK